MQPGWMAAAARCGLLLYANLIAAAGAASASPIIVESLGTRDGLPQGTVLATLHDQQGFVWFGTEDGLVRFDGHELHRYAYSPRDKTGLPGNFIRSIAEDKQGDLWVGVKGSGLARWNRSSDTFTVFRHSADVEQSLASDAVLAVLIDADGLVWIGTFDAGIDVLNPRDGHVRHLRHAADRPDSLADDQVNALLQDHAGVIWVGTHGGLERWNSQSGSFEHHLGAAAGLSSRPSVTQIAEDKQHTLWISSLTNGLFHVAADGQLLQTFVHDDAMPRSLASNDVRSVMVDQQNRLWVGTSNGLNLLDSSATSFEVYRHERTDIDSLGDSFIMSLYQDRSGLIWIGTRAGGVSRWNPRSWELGGQRPAWLDGKLVTSFADAGDGTLWIGSLGGGLVAFDPASGANSATDVGDPRVMSLLKDRRGALWIGTMRSGLKQWADGKLSSIAVQPGDERSSSDAGIVELYQARDGQIWIGTHGGGANVMNPDTGVIRQLPFGENINGAVSSKTVTAFVEDAAGNLWIGTEGGGIDLARPDGFVIKTYRHDSKYANSLSANTIYTLTRDAAGNIWAGTDGGGLERIVGSASKPDAVRFENLSTADGLSSDTIYGIVADNAGQLWLSGDAGLMRFDPVSRKIKTYHREHGLQGEEFDSNSAFRSSNGRLAFGGPGGFNVFDPALLSKSGSAPRLAMTHFEILGVPATGTPPYWLLDHVSLDYHAAIVSFDFAALDFTSPNRNRLSYRMRGLTDDWIDLGGLRRITLTNLEPGDHVLEVRAQNSDSIWSEQPLSLSIHKGAAPWQSTAAYVGYALVALWLLLMIWHLQREKLRRALAAQQRLESDVAVRTQELRVSNRKLVEASEAKNQFLARMGHEIRTPMNGVIGMTELLARSSLSKSQSIQTQTIKSSAQTLLRILNDLLDLSKAQAGKIKLEQINFNLLTLCEECTTLFTGAAAEKHLQLIIQPPAAPLRDLVGDPFRIRQILLNLIGNAVKFTEHGQIIVNCSVAVDEHGQATAWFAVSDTGIGINPAALATIFDPFTQADETTTRRFGGTGLGLSICRELVELMGGRIEAKSEAAIGSRFEVSLALASGSVTRPTPLADLSGASVRVLTRHPSLRDSTDRYLSLLGLAASPHGMEGFEFGCMPERLVIIDVDDCPELVQGCLDNRFDSDKGIVLLASHDAADREQLELRMPDIQIIRKPVTCDRLKDALRGAAAPAASANNTMTMTALVLPEPLRAHVLIVEDEPVNAAVAQGFLDQLGCTHAWAPDGNQAAARAAVEHFDLILMDLDMPGLDGYGATTLIRRRQGAFKRTTIVALTANDAEAHRDFCIASEMDDILGKPYTLSEFAAMLKRWIEPPATSVSMPAKRLDESLLAELAAAKRQFKNSVYEKIVTLFERTSRDSMERLDGALTGREYAAAASAAHKLKSAAANVGASSFSARVAEIEAAAKMAAAEALPALWEAANAQYAELLEHLAAMRGREVA